MLRVTPWALWAFALCRVALADDATLSCRLHSASAGNNEVQTIAIRFNQSEQRVWLGSHAVDARITATEIFFDTSTRNPRVMVHFNIKRLTGHISIVTKDGDLLMEGDCMPAHVSRRAPAAS